MIADLRTMARDARTPQHQPDVRVLVVDDHASFADLLSWALQSVPGMASVGTATSAAQGLALAADLQPDVVVMDIEMPGTDGIVATRELRSVAPQAIIAIVTAHSTGEWLFKAAQAGASAFIPKGGSMKEMIDMLLHARRGHMLVADSAFEGEPSVTVATPAFGAHGITHREQEVLQLLGQGVKAADMASMLGISLYTCRGYVKTLLKKLGATTQLDAVLKAQGLGLITSR